MEIASLIKMYLTQGRMMQVATTADGKPWVCTVYYVEDERQRLYWLSLPSRRHSREIAVNKHVAIAIAVKLDKPVIGIQAEGTVEAISDKETIAQIMKLYIERYNSGYQFYDNFLAGKNEHVLYCFAPTSFVLFDEVSFPKDGRKQWRCAN